MDSGEDSSVEGNDGIIFVLRLQSQRLESVGR